MQRIANSLPPSPSPPHDESDDPASLAVWLVKLREHDANTASQWQAVRVLKSILRDIETIDARSLPPLDELQDLIATAIGTAVFHPTPPTAGDSEAVRDERLKFEQSLRALREDVLCREPLFPYRRVLSDGESTDHWRRLRRRWSLPQRGYWWPLAGDQPHDIVAFDDWFIENLVGATIQRDVGLANLRRYLTTHGVQTVIELREGREPPEYEVATELMTPEYDGREGFWSSESNDWILYVSHEESVTVGGWLLRAIQVDFPEWRDHLWDGREHFLKSPD